HKQKVEVASIEVNDLGSLTPLRHALRFHDARSGTARSDAGDLPALVVDGEEDRELGDLHRYRDHSIAILIALHEGMPDEPNPTSGRTARMAEHDHLAAWRDPVDHEC